LNSRPHPPTLPAGAAFLAASHALHIANTPAPSRKLRGRNGKLAQEIITEMRRGSGKLRQGCA